MEEKSFEELFNESLNNKRFDKTITGTVINVSSKGEIFVDFGYKADGIIPLNEYSDDEKSNPKEKFKTGDTITADVLKWTDGLGNVLLSYKRVQKREKIRLEKERRLKEAEEREQRRIERANSIKEFWDSVEVGKSYMGTISKIEKYGFKSLKKKIYDLSPLKIQNRVI